MVMAPTQLFSTASRGIGSGSLLASAGRGRAWYVNGSAGTAGATGHSPRAAFATVQAAVNAASAGDTIWLSGFTDESVTITRTGADGNALNNLWIIGVGGRGAAGIAPSTTDATGLENRADDVTLVNVGVAANNTTAAFALKNYGSRFRAYGCKFENGAVSVIQQVATAAQHTAHTHGTCSDTLFEDCEFAWGTDGIAITCSDYGAVTEMFVQRCRFHNITTNHIDEAVGSGGSAAVMYATLALKDNVHLKDESATAPTHYILLNGSNANNGVMSGCVFPEAVNGGLVLLSTAMLAVGNYFTGGINTAQPS